MNFWLNYMECDKYKFFDSMEGPITSFQGRFERKLFSVYNTINMFYVSIPLFSALSKRYTNIPTYVFQF